MTTELKRHADGERWLPIPGYEGRYDVSDHGRVRRLKVSYGRALPAPEIATLKRAGRYWSAQLSHSGFRTREYIHRLVLLAFVGPAPAGREAAHVDGDTGNNRLANLMWATRSENAEHRRAHGTMPIGEACINAKLTEAAVREIRAMPRSYNASATARRFGVSRSLVRLVKAGKVWAHVC